jgi:S-adenosylmethionine:tRNA ribosyltransferase-isomerase
MRTADFDFALPFELVAQAPVPERDQSRLLVLHRNSDRIEHRRFFDLPEYLNAGDVLVLNDSRVIPARLRGANARTGGEFEVLLLEENGINDWWVMLRPGKRARVGTQIQFRDVQRGPAKVRATVIATNPEGHRRLQFSGTENVFGELELLGEVPLPRYIERSRPAQLERDRETYQTVYAGPAGSVAAPTAGLHFTHSLLDRLRALSVRISFLTLHVGLGTFAPVRTETISTHPMHEERYDLSQETAHAINEAKRGGRRVIAVGTTTLRALETLACAGTTSRSAGSEVSPPGPLSASENLQEHPKTRTPDRPGAQAVPQIPAPIARDASPPSLVPGSGRTRIFIYPPYDFKIVDVLLTNFHLPRSTLLMLASAFAAPNGLRGRDLLLSAYSEAIRRRYRFFSYGDAMLIL